MASEDSDQRPSRLSAIHCLRDLGDLDESGVLEMSTGGHQLHAPNELLEVVPLRSTQRVLREERNDHIDQLISPANVVLA
jgi:hypothetical protein